MIAFRNELYGRQFLRTLSHAIYGGADLGECLVTARAIHSGDRGSWYRAWMTLGEKTLDLAAKSASGGHRVSARNAFLRASNYFRNASVFHLERPLPELVVDAHRLHCQAFARAAALMEPILERIHMPFESGTLPGYFCPAATGERRPLIISVGGYDSSAEEAYFYNAVAANARGYHCLIFDGPGQGSLLIQEGIPFRPDWQKVLIAIVDAMMKRADVLPDQIVLVGESWGGYWAPRAAAVDSRIAACVVDPGQIGLQRAMLARLPLPASIKAQLPDGPRWLIPLLRWVLNRVANKPDQGWALRRGMLVHDVACAWDYFVDARNYDQSKLLGQIRCPTLVCDAEDDPISSDALEFFQRLNCEKHYLRFRNEDGAGDHCIAAARTLFHTQIFDWVDETLNATRRNNIRGI